MDSCLHSRSNIQYSFLTPNLLIIHPILSALHYVSYSAFNHCNSIRIRRLGRIEETEHYMS